MSKRIVYGKNRTKVGLKSSSYNIAQEDISSKNRTKVGLKCRRPGLG